MVGLMNPSQYNIFPKTFLTKATSVLEVERKFLPTATSISLLRANTGKPSFRSFKSLGVSHTHDVYYDRENALLSQGIYVRRRNGNWEAKIRQGGDYTNSQFLEYEGKESVSELVKKALEAREENMDKGTVLWSLKKIVDFKTKRELWDIDGFKVVIDNADFGHMVGEVELCDEIGEDPKKAGIEMDRRIEKFMEKHTWAFPEGKALGKLSAYWLSKARKDLELAYPVPDWAQKELGEGGDGGRRT